LAPVLLLGEREDGLGLGAGQLRPEEPPRDHGDGGETGAWEVDTNDCPEDATAPIEGTIKVGTALPLSGGAAAAAFAPVAAGMRGFFQNANENDLLPGYEIELTIEDDQYNANLTTGAVESLIDETGVNLFSGIIGTPNNLAVRDLLNGECYPQLFALTGSPEWGDVANYPWTTGALVPYNTETAIYVENMKEQFPDGGTAAVFYVNSEFGEAYSVAFNELAPDANIEIVEEQTIEATDSNPPTSQITAISGQTPDIILAVPLGAQCPAFLSELANAKAANPGWEPRVYITATCASTLLLSIAGAAADGIVTTIGGMNANDPAFDAEPAMQEYKQALDATGQLEGDDYATAYAGWAVGEYTLEVLRLASESPDGITRASIMNAARAIDYHASLGFDGINFTMNGEEDPYGLESQQVVEYDADTRTYTNLGDIVSQYEGATLDVPGGFEG